MRDSRITKLAKQLVNYSVKATKGDHVHIQGHVAAKPLMLEIIKELREVGAYPYVDFMDNDIAREVSLATDEKRLEKLIEFTKPKYEGIDCSIRIYADDNDYFQIDVPDEKKQLIQKTLRPIKDIIIGQKRWVLLNYPIPTLAHKAKMTNEQFFDYVMDVSTVDYAKMSAAMSNLVKLMDSTDKVRITGPETDLSFSLKGLKSIPCAGELNIPDGEVFSAPVKESVNGTVKYNTPSSYFGNVYEGVKLTFKDGKIIEATCDNERDNEKLNKVFETDEGARFVGEFAIGVNPLITEPMGDILYDEKIMGSFHFTPGQAYDGVADNGNKSAVHWDLVCIQRPEYGGGEIWFDDVLIRKDGVFVVDELLPLNPENLL